MSEMKREHERQNPDEYATDPHQHAALAPGAWCAHLDDLNGEDVTVDTPLCSYQAPKDPGVMTGTFEVGHGPDVVSVVKDGTVWVAAVGPVGTAVPEDLDGWQPLGYLTEMGFTTTDEPVYRMCTDEPIPDLSFGGPGWFERFRKAQAERDEMVKDLASVTQSFTIDDPEAARAFLAALEPPVRVLMHKGDDDALVVQVDTENLPDDVVLRVNVNDAPVFQGRPEHDRSDLDKMQSVSDVVARWSHGHMDPSTAMSAIARVVGS